MRKITLKFTPTCEQDRALIFFAQALDEQLFDLTDDSFKAPALNTFSRTFELQSVALANHRAGISKEALKPFIEELEWSISKDASLSLQKKALCKTHIASFSDNSNQSDAISRATSGLRVILGEYFNNAMEAITNIIENTPGNKKDLLGLVSIFIVQAETHGFPRRHTYHVTQNLLMRRLKNKASFDRRQLLTEFFERFPSKSFEYDCLYFAEGSFENHKRLLDEFKISLQETPPRWINLSADQQRLIDTENIGKKLISISSIKTPSPAHAYKIGSNRINEFAGIALFYKHREVFKLEPLALIRDKTTDKVYTIHDAPDPMHCWVSHANSSEEEMLGLMSATHGNLLMPESADRLQRTVRLHRSALKSTSAENQLIDLWAGLEGLVSRPGRESVRIEYFSECLIPSLTLTYPEKLFLSAYIDVRAHAPGSSAIFATMPGADSNFSKFVRVILCGEHKRHQIDLCELLNTSPLLLNRVWRLSELFKSRTATQQTLRHHRQKIKWHMSRIYHTRNSIMHSAKSLPYLPTLVENLHVYVDTLVKSIQAIAKVSPERQTIEGALEYLGTWERYRLHAITHEGVDNDATLTDESFWGVVFGNDMALAPNRNKEPLMASPPEAVVRADTRIGT